MSDGENRPLRFTETAVIDGETYTVSSLVALARGIEYRGTVDYVDLLPESGNANGDCRTVLYKGTSEAAGTEPDGGEYVWAFVNGTPQWIRFENDTTYKANKVDGEVEGHIPSLGADGDLEDSGVTVDEVEDLLENAARKDGEYPDLTAGTANQLGSAVDIVNDAPFAFRTTAGGMDVADATAKVEKITGQTIRWQQKISRSGSSSTAQWAKTNATSTVTDGVYKITSTRDSSAQKSLRTKLEPSHIYAASAWVRGDAGTTVSAYASFFRESGSAIISGDTAFALTNSWKVVRRYAIMPAGEDAYYALRLANTTANGAWAEFKNVMLFDLTEMYGAGREPSEQLFWATYPAGWYEWREIPKLVSTRIPNILESTGFNAYDPSSGIANILGGMEYEIVGTYTSVSFFRYDYNYQWIEESLTPVNGKFTTDTNGYIEFTGAADDLCVHLVWSGARDGQKEAYSVSGFDIDFEALDDLFDGSMNSVRNSSTVIADELTAKKGIRRTVRRTLDGSENWSVGGTAGTPYFQYKVSGYVSVVDGLIISDRFRTISINSSNTNIGIYGLYSSVSSGSFIYIRPENYEELTTAEDFKEWLAENPVEVIYYTGSAREEEKYLDWDFSYHASDYGTERFSFSIEDPVPATTEFHTVISYKRNLREKLERLPESPDEAGLYLTESDGVNMRYAKASDVLVSIEDLAPQWLDYESAAHPGDYCVYKGMLCLCIAADEDYGEFNPERWLPVTIGERMMSMQQSIDLITSLEKNRGLSAQELQRIAASGHADKFLSVGDVIYIPYTYTAYDGETEYPTEYQYPFVVTCFRDVYDENNQPHRNAVCLQALYATQVALAFDAPEAIIAQAGETFTQGTYYFTKSGSEYSQAEVTYGATIPASPIYYKHRFSGANGANVIRYGYNRYSQSAIRQWLNSDAACGEGWWTPQHEFDAEPTASRNWHGWLNGFTEEWKAIFKPVRVQTAANTVTDGGVTDTTYDRFFLPSVPEMYGSQTLAGTEGAPWQYWIEATGFESGKNGSSSDTSEARMIPAIPAPGEMPGAAVYFRLRSAYRPNAYNTYNVHASGYIYHDTASHAIRALPACFIY